MHKQKPWHRPRNLILLALLVLVAFLGIKGWLLVTAKPVVAVDYTQKIVDLVESNQPPAAEAPDAWPLYTQAVQAAYQIGIDVRDKAPSPGTDFAIPDYSLIYTPDTPFTPNPSADPDVNAADAKEAADKAAKAALTREWSIKALGLLKDRGVYDQLQKLTTARRFVRPKAPEGPLLLVLLPELGQVRNLTRALAARMDLAGKAGDDTDLIAAFEQSLALTRAIGFQATLIERLVSTAITALALGQVREEAMRRPLSADTCKRLLAAIDRQIVRPPMSLPMTTEHYFALDIIQRTHSDNGRGGGYRLITEYDRMQAQMGTRAAPARPRIVNLGGLFVPSRQDLTAKVDFFYGRMEQMGETPRAARAALNFNPDLAIESLSAGYDMLKEIMPALGKAFATEDQFQLGLAGTRTMLAIEAFRAENGRLPASLDELVPAILPRLPIDPFAHDGRFRYRILTAPDPLGRTYLLYSIGADGTDDGGTVHPHGNYNALNLSSSKGTDFIINIPR